VRPYGVANLNGLYRLAVNQGPGSEALIDDDQIRAENAWPSHNRLHAGNLNLLMPVAGTSSGNDPMRDAERPQRLGGLVDQLLAMHKD
jgi:hypothetical protein